MLRYITFVAKYEPMLQNCDDGLDIFDLFFAQVAGKHDHCMSPMRDRTMAKVAAPMAKVSRPLSIMLLTPPCPCLPLRFLSGCFRGLLHDQRRFSCCYIETFLYLLGHKSNAFVDRGQARPG